VYESFKDYVHNTWFSPPHECLADYIYAWVMSGLGAEMCQRDFTLLQTASLVIADYWCCFPSITNYDPDDRSQYVERRVVTIFKKALYVEHPILNPDIFQ